MPLVTRQANQGNLFKADLEPADLANGDLWSDTTANKLKLDVLGTVEIVGAPKESDNLEINGITKTVGQWTLIGL